LWSLLGAGLFVGAQTAAVVAYIAGKAVADPTTDWQELVGALNTDGTFIAIAALASGTLLSAFLFLVVYASGCPVRSYLGLISAGRWQTIQAIGLLLLFMAILDGLTYLSDRPIVPEWSEAAYRSAGFLPLLFLAVAVAAPVSEELFFRGFLYRGLAASWLRPLGAILVTSAIWAAIHLQYDAISIGGIFVMGIFLGVVRQWTGSTALTILLHAINNSVAMIQALVKVEYLS
jgi:membrane protease YdiL (CAAX protease family)